MHNAIQNYINSEIRLTMNANLRANLQAITH